MIGFLKNKSQYYTDLFFFVQYQEFLLFTQELFHFTQEIVPILPKKLRTPYSRNLRVPSYDTWHSTCMCGLYLCHSHAKR